MRTHTPGPWTNDGSSIIDARGRTVAETDFTDTLKPCIQDGGEIRANADLIANAPGLLETMEWIAQTVHQAHHDGLIDECRKNTCTASRVAAGKARGES